jgi:hypothetical protein
MKKAFTFTAIKSEPNDPDAFILDPEREAAKNSRRIIQEMERQNEITEESNRIRREELNRSNNAEKP